jgi:hypothetical protein
MLEPSSDGELWFWAIQYVPLAPPPAQAGSWHQCQSVPFSSLLNTVAPVGGVGRPSLLPPLLSAIPSLFSPVVLLLVVVAVVVVLVVPPVLPEVFVVLIEFVLLLIVVSVLLVVVLLLPLVGLLVVLPLVMVIGEEKLAAGFVLLLPHPAKDRQTPIIIQEKIYFMIDRCWILWIEGESYAFT